VSGFSILPKVEPRERRERGSVMQSYFPQKVLCGIYKTKMGKGEE